jgi:hypothetical protein
MNAYLAYSLGLITGLLFLFIAFLFALFFVSFRNIYTGIVCNFPQSTNQQQQTPNNTA